MWRRSKNKPSNLQRRLRLPSVLPARQVAKIAGGREIPRFKQFRTIVLPANEGISFLHLSSSGYSGLGQYARSIGGMWLLIPRLLMIEYTVRKLGCSLSSSTLINNLRPLAWHLSHSGTARTSDHSLTFVQPSPSYNPR